MVTTKSGTKFPCPHEDCPRHKVPFDSFPELRGHLGWHGRKDKSRKNKSAEFKNESRPSRSRVIMEALKESKGTMSTAELVDVLRQKGYNGSQSSLRTAVGAAARGSDKVVRMGRGQYRWYKSADDPSMPTPGEPSESLEVVIAERNRLRVNCQRLVEINMQLMSMLID